MDVIGFSIGTIIGYVLLQYTAHPVGLSEMTYFIMGAAGFRLMSRLIP